MPGRHDQRVEVSEKYFTVTPPIVNMWCAHTLIDSDGEQPAARRRSRGSRRSAGREKIGDRLGDRADEREEHHVDDRVAVEPEQVLVGDRRRRAERTRRPTGGRSTAAPSPTISDREGEQHHQEVASIAHVKTGMRSIVIPGARRRRTVASRQARP